MSAIRVTFLLPALVLMATSTSAQSVLLTPPALVPPPADAAPIEPKLSSPRFDPRSAMPPAEASQLTALLQYFVRANIPQSFIEDDDWDQTERVYAGVKVRMDGWKLRTKRRWRELNHGAWRRVELTRIDPEERLDVWVSEIEPLESGRWRMRLQVESPVIVKAEWMQWSLGVRLWSLTTVADARLRLDVVATIGASLDLQRIPPDFVLDPVVESGDFAISQFNVQRIGHLHGDIGEELGRLGYQVLEEAVVEPAREEFTARLNRQIEKKRDDLRVSPSKWIDRFLAPSATNEEEG